jgi:Cu+-exporting ATPase
VDVVLLGIGGIKEGVPPGAWAPKLEEVLRKVNGVATATVNGEHRQARIEYDPDTITITDLLQVFRRLGLTAGVE